MRRIQRQHIERDTKEYFIADAICNATNVIRNECISFINAHYEKYKSYDVTLGNYPGCKKGLVYSANNLFHIFKNTGFMFRDLFCSKTAKLVFKDVDKSYKGYREALKDYYKNKHKYKGMPKPPKEKTDKNRYVAKFEAEVQIVTSLNSGYISIGGNKFIIDIPNTLNLKNEKETYICPKTGKQKTRLLTEIKEISINPTRNGYEILISYDKNEIIQEKPDNSRYLGIDIGVSSLMAISGNHLDWTPTMINGNKLKKLITAYKRETYHYRKLLGKNKRTSKRIQSILFNFENRKRDYCHKLARQIVNMAIENDISKIVIGNNKFWKQRTNLGKNTNLFQLLPYDTIIALIKEKAEYEGIEVIVREESYTSKLSFLDLDSFSLTISPFGKRIKRSIYYSSNYGNIHADINAALNILRKHFGDNIFDITNIKKYKMCPKYAEIKLN